MTLSYHLEVLVSISTVVLGNKEQYTFLTFLIALSTFRLVRTNLDYSDVKPIKEQLAQSLFDHVPVGVGSQGVIPITNKDLEDALEMGLDWSLREGFL